MAGFDRSDKLARRGEFPRSDLRKRSNFARVKGGSSRGPGNLEFTQPNYTLDENGGSIYVSLTRTNGEEVVQFTTPAITITNSPVGPASVNFGTADPPFGPGAGTAVADYVTARRVPTWITRGRGPSDAQTGPNNVLRGATDVFISVTEDAAIEGDELVDLVLSVPQGLLFLDGERIPTGVALGVSRATLTVVDNDFNPGVLTFPQASFRVDENVGAAIVAVIRTNGSAGPISCDYTTVVTGSSALLGTDYTATSGSINFASGQLTNTFTVAIVDDTAVELDETITVQLLNPRGGSTLGLTNAAILIIDNDFAAGRLNFSQAGYSVAENAGTALISVLRSGGSQGALTVQVAVTNGTATAPAHFATATNTLVWASAETTTKTFT
ncbi:MAG: Calx-beta domain-containing protein, partial [Fibrobacterota bacterium]